MAQRLPCGLPSAMSSAVSLLVMEAEEPARKAWMPIQGILHHPRQLTYRRLMRLLAYVAIPAALTRRRSCTGPASQHALADSGQTIAPL